MFKHLFKLIWNKKKENFLLISEVLISFMIIFAVLSLIVYYYQNYKQPMGIDYEPVWSVSIEPLEGVNPDSVKGDLTLINSLKTLPQVRSVSYSSSNFPFSYSMIQYAIDYKGKGVIASSFEVDDDYRNTMQLELLSGRWFTTADDAAVNKPIVVNKHFVEAAFPGEDPIGKLLSIGDKKVKVIGVVQSVKVNGDFKGAMPGFYKRLDPLLKSRQRTLLIRTAPGSDVRLEEAIYKMIAQITKSPGIEINHLSALKKEKNGEVLVPMIIILIVAGFLIINVALGLFGVLWYNINKRRAEIGLRRAIGASAGSVYGQLVGEALVLATFAMIIGSFFAVQFPLLNVFDLPASVYLTAQLLSTVFIYLLVIVCALYPGRQAASIYPAVALHED